jgi:predicted nuclease of restriction endonuclease-like RecB superfamily
MEAKYPIITLGATVCEKLRDIYFSDKHWSECYKDVAQKFTFLKQIMRRFYTDKTDIDILKELIKYSNDDIVDIFNI